MASERRQLHVIHQSLVRPILIMGAERPLAIVLWSVCAGLVIGPDTLSAALAGVILAITGHPALAYLAKIDPQFFQVYVRHCRYRQDYYPARASIWAPPPARIRPTVPVKKEF